MSVNLRQRKSPSTPKARKRRSNKAKDAAMEEAEVVKREAEESLELPTRSPLSNEEQWQIRSPSVKDGNKAKGAVMEEAEVA